MLSLIKEAIESHLEGLREDGAVYRISIRFTVQQAAPYELIQIVFAYKTAHVS